MRVLAYSFDRAAEARLARRMMLERYRLPPDDVRVGDLANDGVLLGFTAPEHIVLEIHRLMEAYGGSLSADVDERRAETAAR